MSRRLEVVLTTADRGCAKAGPDHLDARDPSHSPATAPTPLSSTPEWESRSPPQMSEISPPIVEPIKIPIQMDDRMLSGLTRKDAAQMKTDPQNVKRPLGAHSPPLASLPIENRPGGGIQ